MAAKMVSPITKDVEFIEIKLSKWLSSTSVKQNSSNMFNHANNCGVIKDNSTITETGAISAVQC